MNTVDVRRYEMLVRVKEFGAAHPDRFPADGLAGQLFTSVGDATDQLLGHVVSQATGHSSARKVAMSKSIARDALRDALENISRTARALALDAPGLDDRFRVPRSRGDHTLATAARAFAKDAEPLAAQFVLHGLPASFLTDLAALIDAFDQAASEQVTAVTTHVGARAGIRATLEAASAALQRLDAIVPNVLHGTPTLLAEWNSVRHVERVRAAGSQPVPTPVPVPVTGPATVAPPATPGASA